MLTLKSLIESQSDILNGKRVKLVRHKDDREEYRERIKHRESLLIYQEEQTSEVFKECDYIISFVGQDRNRSVLFGIFKVNGVRDRKGEYIYYDLEEIHDLDYLNDRVVIDWGSSARGWHQWYHKQDKEIVEIYPAGYVGSFPGLLEFVLEYEDLKKLTENPDANYDWKNHLSSVKGIYMILDTSTGHQYIGSACGKEGIWQRWQGYAKDIHGGNKLLKKLYLENPNCYKNFKYSVLQTLPSNVTNREIIKIENLYKEKLGTRVFGLNGN